MERLTQLFLGIEINFHNTKRELDTQFRDGTSPYVFCPLSSTLSIVGASVCDELVVLMSVFGLTKLQVSTGL